MAFIECFNIIVKVSNIHVDHGFLSTNHKFASQLYHQIQTVRLVRSLLQGIHHNREYR